MKPHIYPCILAPELVVAKAVRGSCGPTRTLVKISQRLTGQKQLVTTLRDTLDLVEEELIASENTAYDRAESIAHTISAKYFPEDGNRGAAFHICKGLVEYICTRNYYGCTYGLEYPEQEVKSDTIDLALFKMGIRIFRWTEAAEIVAM